MKCTVMRNMSSDVAPEKPAHWPTLMSQLCEQLHLSGSDKDIFGSAARVDDNECCGSLERPQKKAKSGESVVERPHI